MKHLLIRGGATAFLLLMLGQAFAQDSDTLDILRSQNGKVAFAR